MNTQGIGNSSDGWAQFVKLTQEARLRNKGIQNESVTFSVNSKIAAGSTATQEKTAPIARNNSFMRGEPQVKAKILGGLFDAYA